MKPFFFALALLLPSAALQAAPALPPPAAQSSIVLLGNGLGDRMQYDGYFETLLHLRYPEKELTVRNMCFPGDTASYRPRAGRNSQWAFPGAEKFRPEFKPHRGNGIEPSPDEWLQICKPDTIIAFFGYNESFDGPAGIEPFKAELEAWIAHTRSQTYNGKAAPAIVLVSPIHFENLSELLDLPDGKAENTNLALYAEAMRAVAEKTKTGYVDLFGPSREIAAKSAAPITSNGFLPNDEGNRLLAPVLADAIYGPSPVKSKAPVAKLREQVVDKAWHWRNDYRITNGVHVYGRRRAPYGTVNYPQEIEKLRQLTANRDRLVWATANG